jgi:hypothetical protein
VIRWWPVEVMAPSIVKILSASLFRILVGGGTDAELNAFEVKEIWVQPGTPRVKVSLAVKSV